MSFNHKRIRTTSTSENPVMTLWRRTGVFMARTAAASTAMTASQHLEMLVTRREPSDFPVRVAEQLTGRTVPAGVARAAVGHLAQASLAAMAVVLAERTRHAEPAPAVALICVALVVGDAAIGRLLGLSEAPWKWARRDLAIEFVHKTSLAIASRALTGGVGVARRS